MAEDPDHVRIGQSVFDDEGTELGTVRGFDASGFFVSTRDGIEGMSVEHERAGHEFGEAELLWRCAECGELGDIADIPDRCPNCGAPKEAIYYWIED